MRAQMISELPNSGSIPAFGNEHNLAPIGVRHERQIIVPALVGGLVDGNAGQIGQIDLGQRKLDVAPANRVHAVPRFAHRARHSRKRHLLGERQHQGLEQEREPAQLAGPIRLDQNHAAVREFHPWCPHLKIAVVLKEDTMGLDDGQRFAE